ncbi:MAG: shikimate dehydrogenase, partial [Endozoicomonas sp.]
KEGKFNGDNTDGLGLVADLKNNHDINIKNARVLVLGAGGAVRGILEPMLSEQPSEIVIANRTLSKVEALVEQFPDEPLSTSSFVEIDGQFDLIINGTAASLQGDLPPIPAQVINSNTYCYDMMYGADETLFNHWCREQGAGKTIDGLGMLVEQAAEQFFIWRGMRPDTTSVLKLLHEELV